MLADKIDVTEFMVWFMEKYPESTRMIRFANGMNSLAGMDGCMIGWLDGPARAKDSLKIEGERVRRLEG